MSIDCIDTLVTAGIGLIGALSGGGLIFWRVTKKTKMAEAQKSTTEARLAEADLADQILKKFESSVLSRMESGEAVRKQEFEVLTAKIDKRFDVIEEEDRKQNDTIRDIAEYLNGGFQKFEASKRRREAKQAKKAKAQAQ